MPQPLIRWIETKGREKEVSCGRHDFLLHKLQANYTQIAGKLHDFFPVPSYSLSSPAEKRKGTPATAKKEENAMLQREQAAILRDMPEPLYPTRISSCQDNVLGYPALSEEAIGWLAYMHRKTGLE